MIQTIRESTQPHPILIFEQTATTCFSTIEIQQNPYVGWKFLSYHSLNAQLTTLHPSIAFHLSILTYHKRYRAMIDMDG